MRKILLTTIISLISFSLFAQSDSNTHKHYSIYAYGGIGIPVGTFGQGYAYGLSAVAGGFALTGPDCKVSLDIPFKYSKFGMELLIGYNSNQFNLVGYLNAVNYAGESFYNFHPPPYVYVPHYFGSNNGCYVLVNGMIGPYYQFQLRKICFDLKILIAGMTFYQSPDLLFYSGTSSQFVQKHILSATSVSFSFGVNMCFKYLISKRIMALVDASFIYTQPTVSTTGDNLLSSMYIDSPISIVGVNLGLGYQFGK